MANKRYIPKFQGGGYFGVEAMKGEKGLDIRNLATGLKRKKHAFQKAQAKRAKWRGISDLIETGVGLIPGIGQIVKPILNVLSEQAIQKNISVKGGPDLGELETMWTGGEGTALEEEFQKMYGEADETLGEGLIRGVTEFAGSKLSSLGMSKFGEFTSEKFAGSPKHLGDWGARTLGIGGDEFAQEVTAGGLADNPWLAADYVDPDDWREGGQVPKYYGGGNVQSSGTPTIVDYFARQGKTLGGSNKQSLAEMLGKV